MESPAKTDIINDMSGLLAQQKLVPFFGAGISRQHLGVAAPELTLQMAERVGLPSHTALSDIADHFEQKFGRDALLAFLRDKLVVKDLDDSKVPAHRLLLSLSPSVLYTPNQDNVFELTATLYGRPYRRVVTLQDLSDAAPGERLLYKYHGDFDHPETIVFGRRSYLQRMTIEDHPLDIRLRSDLLGKRLLFLGYSFRDENVIKLIESISHVFKGKLPPSYLIAFEYDPLMEELQKTYGIHILDPLQFYPDAPTRAEAFERLLKELCDFTIKKQAERGLESLFSAQRINPRMVTEFEVQSIDRAVEDSSFEIAAKAFQGAFDSALIPVSLESRAIDIFRRLVERADPADDSQMATLKSILFNLYFRGALAPTAMAYVMAACNRRRHVGFDWNASLICPAVPDEGVPVAAAMAVAILRDRGEAITESFRSMATFWFDGANEVPAPLHKYVDLMLREVWPDGRNPLVRPNFLPRKGFHKIRDELLAQFPKQFQGPKQ